MATTPQPEGRAGDRAATGLAYLDIEVKSVVEAGTLTMWVDGERVYARRLSAASGEARRFRKNSETFNAWIKVPPGSHVLKIEVLVKGARSPHEETELVELTSNQAIKFSLVLGRKKEPISLKANSP